MGILLPAALALLALAIPIIIFYMLRLRREQMPVSSSLLWRRVLQDRTANAPWQRLRRNLLLLLQLLLLLLLVISLARPFLFTDAVATGNLVLILDGSASMQTVDEGGVNRFERAKREAASLIDGTTGDSRAVLIWAGPSPSIVAPATGNKGSLHAALDALSPSNGTADMASAVTLAAASAKQLGDATTVLISDGAMQATLPQVPGKASYINVGKSASNIGVTSLSLRDAPSGPQLFASVFNSGPDSVHALLSLKVDGKLRDATPVDLAARDEKTVTLQGLPLDTRLVEAQVSTDKQGANFLAADDKAWALRARPPTSNVLLVSEGNSFLEKALGLLPNMKLFKTTAANYAPSNAFGLTVLDASMPAQVPSGNLLMFAPPNSALVPVSGTVQYPAIGQAAVNDPLLRYVDLSGTHIASAVRMSVPAWARVLARSSTGDPLLMAGETGGRRVAAFAFDLHQSDLPLQVAFPILMANLVEWLQPPTSVDAPALLRPGEPISIRPLPDADEIVVTSPDGGKQTNLLPSTQTSFAGTDALGVYTVEQRAKGKPLGEREQFAVNLFSREESDITPNPNLAFTGTEAAPPTGETRRPLEIWPWVLLASLALLAVEWWVYNRPLGLRRTTEDRGPRTAGG
jgi:Ca-activated chloride channel family protein